MEIQWVLHRQVVGFRKVAKTDGEAGFDWKPGEMLAVRNNGDEILFAAAPELKEEVAPNDVPKEPAAWIPTSDFSVNPFCLAIAEDFVEEDQDQDQTHRGPVPIHPTGSTGPRRRGK